jgi:hypothetical protein
MPATADAGIQVIANKIELFASERDSEAIHTYQP